MTDNQNEKSNSAFHTADRITASTNMMKFVNQNHRKEKTQGKKCSPKQLFGVSIESPDCFKSKHTLIADNGYLYSLDASPQKNQYQYYSQQHYITLSDPVTEPQKQYNNFLSNYNKSQEKNALAFHRRKGRLSDFMDKNGWMSKQFTIMGFERSKTTRQLWNKQRQKKIQQNQQRVALKSKMTLSNEKYKFAQSRSRPNFLMTEKGKIRMARNDLARFWRAQSSNSDRPVTISKKISSVKDTETKKDVHKISIGWKQRQPKHCEEQNGKVESWMRSTCGTKFSNPSRSIGREKQRN